MVHIRNLKLRGFKSFNSPTQVEFRPGLNAIVGGNGSGKSNIVDALRFVLGQLSSKTLRADNYSDLIFKSKNKASGDAVVYFEIDNKESVIPTETSVVQVARRIKPDGSTQYKFNGRNASRQEVVDALSYAKVNPEGHNIILQGDVSRFVEMKPIERRQIVEEIAGISQYEDRKEKALQELSKVDEKLREANIVLREKEAYLNGLYEEKKEAERYRSFSQEMQGAKATKIRLEMDRINHNKNLSENELKKNVERKEALSNEVTKDENKNEEFSAKIKSIEEEIEKKGGEDQLKLQKRVEDLRVRIESGKATINVSTSELAKIEQRRTQLTSDLKELTVKIASAEKTRSEFDQKKKNVIAQVKLIGKSIDSDSGSVKKLQEELQGTENKLEELAREKEKSADEIRKLDSQREILFFKIKDAKNQIDSLKAKQNQINALVKDKDTYRNIIAKLNELASAEEKFTTELAALRQEKTKLDEEVVSLKVNSNAAKELVKRDRAISTLLKSGIKGLKGTVAELGEVESKFAKALKIAAGSRMKNIVVEDESVAIKCLNLLKETKAGSATFLPLNKIRGEVKLSITKKPGVYGLASELVSFDKKFAPVFDYVFGSTVVVEDVNVARAIGIGKYKMVTIDGDVFQTSGAITGGFISKDVGLGFAQSEIQGELDALEKVRKKLALQIESLETQRENLESQALTLRREKSELEGKIESSGKIDEIPLESVEKLKSDLENQLTETENRKVALKARLEEIDKQIIKFRSDKSRVSSHVNEIQFGEKNDQLKVLQKQDTEFSSQLAVITVQLENGLLPEQKNIERVLRELGKEEVKFREQAELRSREIVTLEKELSKHESEEKEAYGKLKQLFKQKSDLKEELDKLSRIISTNRQKISELENERNEISVSKAKIESKLGGLQEELEQVGSVPSLEYLKSVNAAEKKIDELEKKIAEMGNVNLKALEIYESLKGEYDQLASRVQKLTGEKDEINKIISEVEKKKKSSFMESYNKLSKNFADIYSKMADKDSTAELFLENVENPFEAGLQVRIRQDNKFMSVSSLSGGEKVIVALALIFSIQEFNPAPFYLFDEVDAALDNINSEKIAKLLKEYSKKAQIVMISHNDSLISAADYLYGVSMNKEGESKIVSLEL